MERNGVDAAIAPNSSVILDPSESLTFRLQAQASPNAVLTIRNASGDRKIAFKVKTTRPLRYLVRPNQGMLGPNGSASIMIILQQKDCDELLRLDPSERQLSNDKFLVQSIYIDDTFYELAKTKSTKDLADELATKLARTDKGNLSNKKLRCRFVVEEHGESSTRAKSSASSFTNSESVGRRISGGSQLVTARQSDSAEAPKSGESELSSPEQLTSALLQEQNIADAGLSESDINRRTVFGTSTDMAHATSDGAEANKDSEQEIAGLRKKYEELVAFTVQLTAQRDVLITDLDKTRQLLQKANADVQRVKKATEDSSSSTLRQRRVGATTGNGTPVDGARSTKGKTGEDAQVFGLFHLLVCAIIFFLVGRYF